MIITKNYHSYKKEGAFSGAFFSFVRYITLIKQEKLFLQYHSKST